MSCDPNDLTELAKCFQCYDPKQSASVQTYLLAVIAKVDPNPDALLAVAKDFQALNTKDAQAVQAYLLCQIVNANPP